MLTRCPRRHGFGQAAYDLWAVDVVVDYDVSCRRQSAAAIPAWQGDLPFVDVGGVDTRKNGRTPLILAAITLFFYSRARQPALRPHCVRGHSSVRLSWRLPFFTGRSVLVPVVLYDVLLEACVRASSLPRHSLYVGRRRGSRWVCVAPLQQGREGVLGRFVPCCGSGLGHKQKLAEGEV